MTKILIKSRLFPNKNKTINKPEPKISKFTIPPNLQKFKQKLLSGNGFLYIKEP